MADQAVIECAYRAMSSLKLKGLGTVSDFVASVALIDLFTDGHLTPGNVLLGALAVHSYADDLQDYVSTDSDDDFYLAAETAVETDAEGSPWQHLFNSENFRLDTVAAIVELMLKERGVADSPLNFESTPASDDSNSFRRALPDHPTIPEAKAILLGSRAHDR